MRGDNVSTIGVQRPPISQSFEFPAQFRLLRHSRLDRFLVSLTKGTAMRMSMLMRIVVFGAFTAATPVLAQELVTGTVREVTVTQIRTPDLDHFVGTTLYGAAHAPLGVVSAANRDTGVIGVTGRHGEFADIDASLLTHDGWTLHAPTLTAGDIKTASNVQLTSRESVLAAPRIIVVEPPLG